jgi:hypothetical protein
MGVDELKMIQQMISSVSVQRIESIHAFPGVPADFVPWESGLSPSALYNCSVSCRKASGIKTPEVKWMSIKRWVTTSPGGITLPPGCYVSVKRKERFVAFPEPRLEKTDFILVMLPYGNVWSQVEPDEPITEEWLWSLHGGTTVFEMLMDKDAAKPVRGYFAACMRFMGENPDQIGIHLKRKRAPTPS